MRCRVVAAVMLVASGCAHTREPYSYLPPLAPPVYPQPQDPPRPAVQSAPAPVPPVQGTAASAMLPGPMPGGVVPAVGDACCQPAVCDQPMPVLYEAATPAACCE
jgi:hypothetical protein